MYGEKAHQSFVSSEGNCGRGGSGNNIPVGLGAVCVLRSARLTGHTCISSRTWFDRHGGILCSGWRACNYVNGVGHLDLMA